MRGRSANRHRSASRSPICRPYVGGGDEVRTTALEQRDLDCAQPLGDGSDCVLDELGNRGAGERGTAQLRDEELLLVTTGHGRVRCYVRYRPGG